MRAEDTVMSQEQSWKYVDVRQMLQAQAKISFKAGIGFAETAIKNQLLEIIEASKKAVKGEGDGWRD